MILEYLRCLTFQVVMISCIHVSCNIDDEMIKMNLFKTIANHLNQCFVNISLNIASKIPVVQKIQCLSKKDQQMLLLL